MTVLAASLLLAGCSTAPRPAPPTGDIPAASPSPAPTPALDEPDLLDAEQAGAPMGTPSLPPRPTAVSTVAAEKTAGPARTARPSVPRVQVRTTHGLRGVATWFATGPDGLYGAAGPGLRAALGSHWRGRRVLVCHIRTCVRVTLNDWCWCPRGERVIDLSDEAFRRLGRLSAGVLGVTVRW